MERELKKPKKCRKCEYFSKLFGLWYHWYVCGFEERNWKAGSPKALYEDCHLKEEMENAYL